MPRQALRTLVIVLGDQLNFDASAFDGFDPQRDAVWMAEVAEESTHVWSSKQRIAVFLSAMRHCAAALGQAGVSLHYHKLDDAQAQTTLADALRLALERLQPERVVMTAPGDWRVWQSLKGVIARTHLTLETRDDHHFLTTVRDFVKHAQGRKTIRLEYFYRELRRRENVLMQHGKPVGGKWNFDAENREAFGKEGPGLLPLPIRFAADSVTLEVIALVNRRFADHPGDLASFAWPVTREQALEALQDFITHRLPLFGRY
jgi:deoxyribodipyrimidine photolyase-related protein